MADTREVVVTIRSQSLGGNQAPAGSPGSNNAVQGPQSPEVGEGNSVSTEAEAKQQAVTTVAVQLAEKALQEVVNLALGEIDYRIQRSFYLKDNYIGQRNYQIAKAQVNSLVSWGVTVGTMIYTMGPIGLATAAIYTSAKAIHNMLNYAHTIEEQDITRLQLDANLQFNRTRAGYSLTAGSIGENR